MAYLGSSFLRRHVLAVPAGFLAVATIDSLSGATINYGDFAGSTVAYLDVSETANSSGDSEPLYGAPAIRSNSLDFDPAGFTATALSRGADITDGQLSFTLDAAGNYYITSLAVNSSGPDEVSLSWNPIPPSFILQESIDLTPTSWVDSPSASTNPIVIPMADSRKFFRLVRP